MSESATTIDKLSIEITSNSAGASQGIDALAKSLGKLRENGSFGVAVKNLNNLSEALKRLTPVTSNANKLSALAKSVNELSQAGSFTKVVNQLNKLPGALKGLSSLNIDNDLGAKLERLAQATTPLANIKTGGLGTMVNALAKIGQVTDALDDDTINRFADRVEKLNEKLAPLSTRMTTIQQGLRGVNSAARSAGSGVRELGSGVNTTTLNMASMITVVRGVIDALRPVVQLLSNVISQAIEWDGIAARFGRGFGAQAEEVYDWIQRLNREMGINVQQFMQYSSVFATMLTGFGVDGADAGKMALGYTELTYDIWAGYNDVYKTFDEAAEAIKSAIAGEVEPVRRAGFTIVESTLEQTAANHGLEVSLEKATEAQKSYLRYLTLVDQAHAQGLVGTYAAELDTAEGLMRTFSQQLKSLAQTFGSVFLPILVKVMPWLQAFVELLTEAIVAVAGFFGIDIQPVEWGSDAGGLGGITESAGAATEAVDATTGALKDLKKATIGIDELNVISPPTASGGSGGGGAGGAGWDGLGVDSLWDEAIFDQIQSKVDEIKARLEGMLPIVGGIATAFLGWRLAKFIADLADIDLKLVNLIPFAKGIGDSINKALMKAFGGTSLAWIGSLLKAKLVNALKAVALAIAAVPGWAVALVAAIVAVLALAIVDYDFTEIGRKVGELVGKAFRWIADSSTVVYEWGQSVGRAIKNAIDSAVEWVAEQLEGRSFWGYLSFFFVELPVAIKGKIAEVGLEIWNGIWEGIWAGLENLWGNITEFVDGFIQGFKDGFGIHSPSTKFIEIGEQLIAGLLEPFSFSSIKDKLSGFISSITGFFGGGKTEKISVAVSLVKSGWTTVKGWIGKIPGVSQGITLAKSGWSTVKKWLGNLPTLSQAIKLVKSGWSTVKKWIGSIPAVSQAVRLAKSGWSTVKGWVGNIPVLSAPIKLVKSGWSTVKKWLGNLNFNLGFKLPKIGVNWGTRTVLGFKITYPNGFYTYAKGGFPDVGELFVAREAGPEMVGKIGSKTTVANNQQIVEAVSEGVYSAVVAAMRQSESNGNQAVNVYLDGRQITSVVEKRQHERGATIMRNGVYAY